MSEDYFLEDFNVEEPISRKIVLPALEYVKRNILYSWFKIEADYENFARLVRAGKQPRTEYLISRVLTLYQTLLRSIIIKMNIKKYKDFVKEMDMYVENSFSVPEDKINYVVKTMSDFLCDCGLTNISYSVKHWEKDFEESYPT